jgi:murein DD-endopeptidase MepM/ murein hydrolase activator NlpD
MTGNGKTATGSGLMKIARAIGLTRLYAGFGPKLWRGNLPDMPTITTDKKWFLRENRFLIFTRGGPVEVTLGPSFVLTGILVCMAGIAAIFYSALIASHSAIEVIREETIKTAQASTNPANIRATSNLTMPSKTALTDMPQGEIRQWRDHRSVELDGLHPPAIEGKIAQPARPINGRIMAKPDLVTSQTPQIETAPRPPKTPKKVTSMPPSASDNMPMIIQGGKRITVKSEDAMLATATLRPPTTPDPPLQNINEAGENQEAAINITPDTTKASTADLSALVSPIAPEAAAIMNVTAPASKASTNLTARAQEFAIALLPNFASKPKIGEPVPNAKIGALGDGDSDKAARNRRTSQDFSDGLSQPLPPLDQAMTMTTVPQYPQEDGLQSGFFTKQQGPVIPLVTDAARGRKMLLSLNQEIDYIRTTVTGLGIAAEALPDPIQKDDNANDPELKDVMINLAEHRAALRKIPFKSPMLYFYISSDYGNRKHPKTGKVTFHHGVDLAGTWQENVRVAAPGTVIYAGTEGSFGKVVRVEHDFGVVTTYAHLARITVNRGDYIGENHIIGKMGNTGKSAGAHLHYEIRINNKSVNPVKFMNVGRQISVAGELRQTSLIE